MRIHVAERARQQHRGAARSLLQPRSERTHPVARHRQTFRAERDRMDGDVGERADARAIGCDRVEDRKRRVIRQAAPVDRQPIRQRPTPGAQRGGRRVRGGRSRRGDALRDEELAIALGRDPPERVTAFDRARPGVRVHARREDGAELEPKRFRDGGAHGSREATRHAEQVAHEEAHRSRTAPYIHGADLEVVVDLGGRLILDEARELYGCRRRDDRRPEADFQRHATDTAVRSRADR